MCKLDYCHFIFMFVDGWGHFATFKLEPNNKLILFKKESVLGTLHNKVISYRHSLLVPKKWVVSKFVSKLL